jgi:hypothetical protein
MTLRDFLPPLVNGQPRLFVYSMAGRAWWSWPIRVLTGRDAPPRPDDTWLSRRFKLARSSHVGLGLQWERSGVEGACVWEADLDANTAMRRVALLRFSSFVAAHGRSRLWVQHLDPAIFAYDEPRMQRVADYLDSCVGFKTYGKLQLLQHAAFELWGWPVKYSPDAVTCSELMARGLGGGDDEKAPALICDLRDGVHLTYDEVTPESGRVVVERIVAGLQPPRKTA